MELPHQSMINTPGKLIEMSREQREIRSSREFLEKYGKCLENDVELQERHRKLLENCGEFLEIRIEFLESCEGTPRKQNMNFEKAGYKLLESCREFCMR